MSPVIYRVITYGNSTEITVHLGRMTKHDVPLSYPVPDLDALDDIFLGGTFPLPTLEGSVRPQLGVLMDKRGAGAASLTNF